MGKETVETARTPAAARRRQEIIQVSAGLFDERGYGQTSMDDIARALGIRKPSLYHYVHSKDEILWLIHEEFIDLLISRAQASVQLGLQPDKLLLSMMGDVVEITYTHRGHVRVFFEHFGELSSEYQALVRPKRDLYFEIMQRAVAGTMSLAEDNPAVNVTTLGIFGMCNWAYKWYRPEGGFTPREVAEMFWRSLIDGIASSAVVYNANDRGR